FLRVGRCGEFPNYRGPLRRIADALQHHVAIVPRLSSKEKLRRESARLPGQSDAEMIMPRAARIEPGLDRAKAPAAIGRRLKLSVSLEMRVALSARRSF